MKGEFSYRVFRQGGEVLLAISDADIIGMTFSEGDLEITVSKEFYSGSECDEKEAVRLARSSTIVNATGRRIVGLLEENGLVDKKMVLHIGRVPHAQIVSVK